MKLTGIRRVLTMVIAVLVLTASSQAAVCELACGVGLQQMGCHAVQAPTAVAGDAGADMAGMADGHCTHGMGVPGVDGSMQACQDGSCSHASAPVLAKAGSSAVGQFVAVQWLAVTVVPVRLSPASAYGGVGLRTAFTFAGTHPLVVSLRV